MFTDQHAMLYLDGGGDGLDAGERVKRRAWAGAVYREGRKRVGVYGFLALCVSWTVLWGSSISQSVLLFVEMLGEHGGRRDRERHAWGPVRRRHRPHMMA